MIGIPYRFVCNYKKEEKKEDEKSTLKKTFDFTLFSTALFPSGSNNYVSSVLSTPIEMNGSSYSLYINVESGMDSDAHFKAAYAWTSLPGVKLSYFGKDMVLDAFDDTLPLKPSVLKNRVFNIEPLPITIIYESSGYIINKYEVELSLTDSIAAQYDWKPTPVTFIFSGDLSKLN